jgi:MFS family permease
MLKSPEQRRVEDTVLEPLMGRSEDSSASSLKSSICKRWLMNIHFSRWQSFAGVCLYVSVAGTTYAFGVYSNLLKSELGFTQGGLDIIASVGNTGLYMSLLGGMLLDRYGLHFVVYLGGFFIFIGFLYIWLAVEGYVPADILSVSVFFFLSQFGVCCHISSAVTSAVRLFPSEVRGSAVGLAKGYFGLSSAVLSDFSGGYFSKSKAYFILFIAVLIPVVGTMGVSFANFIPQHALTFRFDERRGINTSLAPFFYHWTCLFTVLLAVGYTQFTYEYSGWSSLILPTLLALTVLSVLLLPGFYGDRMISEEDWRTPHKARGVTVDIGRKYSEPPIKQLPPVPSPLPPEYFGGSTGKGDLSLSGSTDDDDDDAGNRNSPSVDSKSAVSRSLSGPIDDDYSDFDVRVKMKDRKDIVAATSSGSYGYGYGSIISKQALDQSEDVDDVESSGGYSTSTYAARYPLEANAVSDTEVSEPRTGRTNRKEVLECYYGASIPLSRSIQTWRFWYLYIAFLTICGTGLMVIDNINAIAEAVGQHPNDFFVALVSLANGLGRVTAGYASDRLSAYLSKLQLLSLVAALMGVAQGMFAIGSAAFLYPSLLLVGYLFGCSVSLLAVNVADIFGPKFVSTNFGAVDSAPIFGSYCFVTGVVAVFYRTNATEEDGTRTCIGSDCFRKPFIINSFCCFTVALVLLSLHLCTPMSQKIRVSRDDRDH